MNSFGKHNITWLSILRIDLIHIQTRLERNFQYRNLLIKVV